MTEIGSNKMEVTGTIVKGEFKTCLVTVTYGNRFEFLSQVISAARKIGVHEIIVVDNNSSPESKKKLSALEKRYDDLMTVITLEENKGSSGGFKAGLLYAQKNTQCEYVWLLDDDNVPDDDALTELFKVCEKMLSKYSHDSFALVSLRKDREQFKKVAGGVAVKDVFPLKSSFRGFDLFQKIKKLFLKANRKKRFDPSKNTPSAIRIPFAPYGGLFFHKSILLRVGFPNDKFFVYSDDHEYTYRLTSSNGRIYLVPGSNVTDVDQSWTSVRKKFFNFPLLLTTESDQKIYYSVRNHAYLDRKVWCDNLFRYFLNKYCYLFLLGILAIVKRDFNRFLLIVNAVNTGESLKVENH